MLKDTIRALVTKYEQNRSYYRSARFNETMLRQEFLDPLFAALGWDITNAAGKNTAEREVLLEEALRANAATHSKKPDYTFRLFSERKFFLEAKKPCVHIDEENDPAKQVRRYGFTAGLKISVLSNFEDLYIYDTSSAVKDTDTNLTAQIKHYHYTDYVEAAEELNTLLGKEAVYSGAFDEQWKDIASSVDYISVDKLFLQQINEWRLLLGKEIYAYMPDVDMEELGDIVQSYINKILFLRVCEDRNIEVYQRLLQIANTQSHLELVAKFREADRRYNSGLFEQKLSDEVIGSVSSSFWTIIRQLYFPESPYSFAVLSSDILGRIYEIFISKKLAKDGNELVLVNKPVNADRDIVTTPTFIVKEILRQSMQEPLAQMDETQILSVKCADIACGSGAFLLEAYQLLCDTLIDWYLRNNPNQLIHIGVNSYKLSYETKRNLLTRCIFGVDKDYNAVEACKFGLLLKLLEGEDGATLDTYHPVLPSLENNIFYGNSLLSTQDVSNELTEIINPFDFGDVKFDFIIGNPPYLKTEDIKNFTPEEHRLYPAKYSSAYKQYDKYFLFIERAFNLLKDGGILGYIVPSKFMKVGAGKPLRESIIRAQSLKAITSFGAYQVFADKSNYTCILLLQNSAHTQFAYSEITDFAKWKVRDTENGETTGTRNISAFSGETWVLCPDNLMPLLSQIKAQSTNLVNIVGADHIFNGIQTSANDEYIFQPTREDAKCYYFTYQGQEYKVEKVITKPYFKTVRGIDALNTYRTFKPNARVIFPYKKHNQHLDIIPLNTIQRKFPSLYQYLQVVKCKLDRPSRDIRPAPATNNEWHRYGRHQSLEACEINEKLIVGVNSQCDKYAVDIKGTLVSSGGTAGYCLVSVPDGNPYSIYYIQAILGSIQGEWLASLYGEIFKGGFIARGTKVLKQMPIRTIDFSNAVEKQVHDGIVDRQRRLITLGDRIAQNAGNARRLTPLQRQFDALKAEQQQAINALYGMNEQTVALIPIIKDLYATD